MMIGMQMPDDEEFEAFTRLPENADRRFELIDGEIIEVISSPFYSEIAALIAAPLVSFVIPRRLGHITGAGAGYRVGQHRFMPDVAFLSKARQAQLPLEGYNPIAPDLAIEVVALWDKPRDIERRLEIYVGGGVLVWLVYPGQKRVEVYAPNHVVLILGVEDVLDGGDILPGFILRVRDIFPE